MADLPSWARRGVKVVCIGPEEGWADAETDEDVNGPAIDEECTVESAYVDPKWGAAIMLKEHPTGPREGFMATYFRPLVDLPEDVEADVRQFKPLLDTRLTELAGQLDQQWVGMPDLDNTPNI